MRRFPLLLPWMLFATFVGVIFGWVASGKEWVLAGQLAKKGASAQGHVLSVTNGDALNCPSVSYRFLVDGTTYYGHSHIVQARKHDLGPGVDTNVLYLPSDPKQSGIDLEGMTQAGKSGLKITLVIEAVLAVFFVGSLFAKPVPRSRLRANPAYEPRGSLAIGVLAAGFMSLVGLTLLFTAALPDYEHSNQLAESSRVAIGQITSVTTKSKSRGLRAHFSFSVNGHFFHGSDNYVGSTSDQGPIEVHYLPSDPDFSTLDVDANVSQARSGLFFMAIWNLIALVIALSLFVKWRKLQ